MAAAEKRPLVDAHGLWERLVEVRPGITVQRIHDLARNGLIPCVREGRRIFFDPEKVIEHYLSGGSALPGGWKRGKGDK